MKLCPIQDICKKYSSGGNKPPNNDVRQKFACRGWLDYSCPMGVELYVWFKGSYPACDIRRKKK